MYDVDESYLLAGFDAMEAECGSIDGYLASLVWTRIAGRALRMRLLV
ncbi:hypothetical protein K663_17086 [Sphingobium sp. MI1205]|nr:tyrosine-protein phosphatase [Sphingobium sp. MI1205]AMK19778.1 hypothetical protein K663_17086 [Sphingobium sp. MI1205]